MNTLSKSTVSVMTAVFASMRHLRKVGGVLIILGFAAAGFLLLSGASFFALRVGNVDEDESWALEVDDDGSGDAGLDEMAG